MTDKLIDQIYEAGTMPERWPSLIHNLAKHFGAMTGLFMKSTIKEDPQWITSDAGAQHMLDFMAGGWMELNPRIPFLSTKRPARFLTDGDMLGDEFIRNSTMFNQFLNPRGLVGAMSTTVQGLTGDLIIISVEGFPSHAAAAAARANLDALRGHIARAAIFSSQLGLGPERARTMVAAIEAVGAPAAVLRADGTLRAANGLFQGQLGGVALDFRSRFRLADPAADHSLARALHAIRWSKGTGTSIPIKGDIDNPPSVLHVLPVRGNAHDFFSNTMVILVLAVAGRPNTPEEALLQGLFGLTPPEAGIARALVAGATVDQASAQLGISLETTRAHAKGIYSKTGVRGRVELMETLGRLGKP